MYTQTLLSFAYFVHVICVLKHVHSSQYPWLDIVSADLSVTICSLLSLKYLVGTSILSKDWNKFNFNHIKDQTRRKVLFSSKSFHSVDPLTNSVLFNSAPIPSFAKFHELKICGEMLGVVALANLSLSNLFLYNPFTRNHMAFLRSTLLDSNYLFFNNYCFSLGSGRYKAKFVVLESERGHKGAYSQVFDLGSGNWSNPKLKKSHYSIYQRCGTFLESSRNIYWII